MVRDYYYRTGVTEPTCYLVRAYRKPATTVHMMFEYLTFCVSVHMHFCILVWDGLSFSQVLFNNFRRLSFSAHGTFNPSLACFTRKACSSATTRLIVFSHDLLTLEVVALTLEKRAFCAPFVAVARYAPTTVRDQPNAVKRDSVGGAQIVCL